MQRDDSEAFAFFETIGYPDVAAKVRNGEFKTEVDMQSAQRWMVIQEHAEAQRRRAQDEQFAARAVDASERSATASEHAAVAAAKSARFAMWAAGLSLLASAIAVAPRCLEWVFGS